MMGSNTNKDSHHIMHLIEEGTIGAEIGVWKGSSSEQFLKRNPEMLYLVDPWACSGYDEAVEAGDPTFSMEKMLTNPKYVKLTNGKDEKSFDIYYDDVAADIERKFGGLENVTVCRMPATKWFSLCEHGPFLDWIYIDGDHSYTGAYNDLCNALKVVKKGGLIIGDDYKWGRPGDKGGVKKAANQWAEENGLTLEQFGENQFVVRL